MDNHLGNNERFSILPGHKSSRHSPHPHLVVKFPVGHISWWPVTKKNNERLHPWRLELEIFPSRLPCGHPYTHQFSRIKGHSRLIMNTSTAPVPRLFPLVNSSFGNNEHSAIARKCAWAVRSRYNRVSLYFHVFCTCQASLSSLLFLVKVFMLSLYQQTFNNQFSFSD